MATKAIERPRAGRRRTARHAIGATLLVALIAALSACGIGFGAGDESGHAELLVSRDFGTETLVRVEAEPLTESDTVMRILDRNAEIETRYGGGFVQSINGLAGDEENGRPHDWLFFVNGIESDRGGADYRLSDGDRVWWDYRDWGATMRVPAVVGQFPEPFIKGFGGGPPTVTEVECLGGGDACETVAETLAEAGADLDPEAEPTARVLVGPWAELAERREAAAIARGPLHSGVYVELEAAGTGAGRGDGADFELVALNALGQEAARYRSGYGIVAATRRGAGPPVWVVSGLDRAGLEAAAAAFNADDLGGRFAIVVGPDGPIPLPVR